MFGLIARAIGLFERLSIVKAVKKTFTTKLSENKYAKAGKLFYNTLKEADPVRTSKIVEVATALRMGPVGYARFRLERKFLATMHTRSLNRYKYAFEFDKAIGLTQLKLMRKQEFSQSKKNILFNYFKAVNEIRRNKSRLNEVRLKNVEKVYTSFDRGFKQFKTVKGNNKEKMTGLFNNSSWLVGYMKSQPNGMLFTKSSAFTVAGLNDNMIDRMAMAPGAGKYLWNTLWLHKRKGSPDKAIKRMFSGAFKEEYAKRKQSFRR